MNSAWEVGVRRLRRQRPGARWFVTVRCARAQFRLRPDAVRRDALGYFLAVALDRYPGVHFHCLAQMSNHLHLVVTDTLGELSNFMCQLLGPLAKTLNALDETSGQVFERRYSAIEIVDDEALLDRIAYTVTNPAAANLVRTVEAWEGLCIWQRGNQETEFSRVHERKYKGALAAAQSPGDVDIEDFTDRYDVEVTPVEGELDRRVEARLEMLAEKYRGKRPFGMKAVLTEDTFAAPNHPKRSPMPLCHASCPDTWRAFRRGWRVFEHAYRLASEIFRGGALSAVFPEHCFRPSMPLLV